LTELFDERQRPLLERKWVLHPQCKSRLYLLCTFKKYTLSSRFNGSGDGVRVTMASCLCFVTGRMSSF
jgi:hypothetical protein